MKPANADDDATSNGAGAHALHSRIIVDNSVWQRGGIQEIADALGALVRAGIEIVTCAPQLLEALWSAHTPAEHKRLMATLGQYRSVEPKDGFTQMCSELHSRLWSNGLVRAVGSAEIQIAVTALQNDCTVVHYDSDFDTLTSVEPRLSHRWAVPRGSIRH